MAEMKIQPLALYIMIMILSNMKFNMKYSIAMMGLMASVPMIAQENISKFFVHGKADLVSTYVSVSYPFSLPLDITLTPSVGFTPWKGMYWDKAGITDVSLKVAKDIFSTKHFSIPVSVQAIASPIYDRTYLVAGIGVGF